MSSRKGQGKNDVIYLALGYADVRRYLTTEELGIIYDAHKGLRYSTFIELCKATAMVRRYEKAAKRP